MPILTAIILFHEYLAKQFIPYYKIKAKAFEAANLFVESYQERMAQEQVNRSGFLSLQWNPSEECIKCDVDVVCSLKLELKDAKIFLTIQDGHSRIRLRKETFDRMYEYKGSISYLMSFLEGHSSVRRDGQDLVNSME